MYKHKTIVLTIFSFILLFSSCFTQKSSTIDTSNQEPTAIYFPEDMSDHKKEFYTSKFYTGEKAYQQHCAPCHNTKVKGKWVVPHFDDESIELYEIRKLNKRHESSLETQKEVITKDVILAIKTYLKYKNKEN